MPFSSLLGKARQSGSFMHDSHMLATSYGTSPVFYGLESGVTILWDTEVVIENVNFIYDTELIVAML